MSVLLYSAITKARQQAPAPGTPMPAAALMRGAGAPVPQQPQFGKYVDALAALVPAEVLAAHAAILGFTTLTGKDHNGSPQTTISDVPVLAGSFWALLGIAALLYVVGHWQAWQPWDCARVLVPPAAFVAWTMLQRSTAFDAVAPSWSGDARQAAGILIAIVLGVVATALAYHAPQE